MDKQTAITYIDTFIRNAVGTGQITRAEVAEAITNVVLYTEDATGIATPSTSLQTQVTALSTSLATLNTTVNSSTTPGHDYRLDTLETTVGAHTTSIAGKQVALTGPGYVKMTGVGVVGYMQTIPSGDLANTGVTAQAYASPSSVTINAQGQITGITAGTAPPTVADNTWLSIAGNANANLDCAYQGTKRRNFYTTLTANITYTIVNADEGVEYKIAIIQGGVGSFTITFKIGSANAKIPVGFGSAGVVNLTTAPASEDWISFVVRAGNLYVFPSGLNMK